MIAEKLKSIKISTILIFSLIILFAGVSLVLWFSKFPGVRKTFAFPAITGNETYIESRYLPTDPQQGLLKYYVEELVLGPLNELSQPIFTRGTKLVSCFERDSVLYVELSDDLLHVDSGSYDFEKSFSIFRTNIKRNFSDIKSVEIYVDGMEGLSLF